MTFEEQVAEVTKLEALAKSVGMSFSAFERIALDVAEEHCQARTPRTHEQTLAEIKRRIERPRMKNRRGRNRAGEVRVSLGMWSERASGGMIPDYVT